MIGTAAIGMSGTTTVNPAYEISGSTSVATNTIVEMFHGLGEYWLFADITGGSGSGSFMMFSGAAVYTGVDQTILTGFPLTVTFAVEAFDTGNYWDAGSPTLFTLVQNTYYLVTACVGQWSNNGTDYTGLAIINESSGIIGQSVIPVIDAVGVSAFTLSKVFRATGASPTVTLLLGTNSASDVTIPSGLISMSVVKLGT